MPELSRIKLALDFLKLRKKPTMFPASSAFRKPRLRRIVVRGDMLKMEQYRILPTKKNVIFFRGRIIESEQPG